MLDEPTDVGTHGGVGVVAVIKIKINQIMIIMKNKTEQSYSYLSLSALLKGKLKRKILNRKII